MFYTSKKKKNQATDYSLQHPDIVIDQPQA